MSSDVALTGCIFFGIYCYNVNLLIGTESRVRRESGGTDRTPLLGELGLVILGLGHVLLQLIDGWDRRLHALGDGLGLVFAYAKGLGHASEGVLYFLGIGCSAKEEAASTLRLAQDRR